ncbi:carboxymuconolactone decarboxylase family protein [Burkholderia sp. Bp9143]|uniref:carboxymuconolactone decarboxylase family protein n=1 Tax=Burkholderia sp. Bp9143 TaxID=2184574 RepID=UPI000F5A7CDA|nr:carboxymuconolactone decarboxylase family protein [Burkholderia sp. Bp9143]RQR24988.1 carboxymuconolactone decarboxylase family protein [Burkholderia sp. Bp9143]
MSDTKKEPNPLFAVIGAVAPVLGNYTQERIVQELWGRPGLPVRDRAIVTVTALVSRNATSAFPNYFNKALDSGLRPAEFSELLTHLAFYASWPYAFDAVVALHGIYAQRGIHADDLPAVAPVLLADDAVGIRPGEGIAASLASASPALQHFTEDLLIKDVWHRPALSARDRSLATVVALAAQGQAPLLAPYLQHATAHGVTKEELGEALAHIAFYAGWGYALQAAQVIQQEFA